MRVHAIVLSVLITSASLVAIPAFAHDPSLHENSDAADKTKSKPVNCVQLADTRRYSNDTTDPDIKALKVRCDAEKKAAVKAAAEKSR